jgi:hypothetical protein
VISRALRRGDGELREYAEVWSEERSGPSEHEDYFQVVAEQIPKPEALFGLRIGPGV